MMQVSAVALTAAILGVLLRRQVPELAMLLMLCAGLWMFSMVSGGLRAVAELLEELILLTGLSDELLRPVIKTVALSILTRLTAEACRSVGEGGAAAFVEVSGTVLALAAALPLVRAVVVLMSEMLR